MRQSSSRNLSTSAGQNKCVNAKSTKSELCLREESDHSVWLCLVSSQHKALFWLFKATSSSTLTCCAIFSINTGGSWTSLDLNKCAIKTKSITKLPFILCHRGQIVDHLKRRAFNCSPCEAFFLFIGWDQLCLSCSWGVHSRTITRMKEFEIQPRIVDTVFTPGFWKMTKDWKCLQDDNKFHHGRQRAYCGEAGLSPPHSAMLLCCRCFQVQRSSKQSLLPTKANSEAEGWCAFATCSATLSNSSIFVQRRPFQRVFYSIRFSGMVS